jgi:hypothetical protein
MASPKTSLETCKVKFPNSDIVFYSMEKRPIYDMAEYFDCPEAITRDGSIITWHNDKVVRYSMKGVETTWYYRPTISDIFYGRCGSGGCTKFNSDGSIYMNWSDGITWYYSPLIDGVYEAAYETFDDTEPCERCRLYRCECGSGQRD